MYEHALFQNVLYVFFPPVPIHITVEEYEYYSLYVDSGNTSNIVIIIIIILLLLLLNLELLLMMMNQMMLND